MSMFRTCMMFIAASGIGLALAGPAGAQTAADASSVEVRGGVAAFDVDTHFRDQRARQVQH